jgi:hypothetical protein
MGGYGFVHGRVTGQDKQECRLNCQRKMRYLHQKLRLNEAVTWEGRTWLGFDDPVLVSLCALPYPG